MPNATPGGDTATRASSAPTGGSDCSVNAVSATRAPAGTETVKRTALLVSVTSPPAEPSVWLVVAPLTVKVAAWLFVLPTLLCATTTKLAPSSLTSAAGRA